eukprot:TRINITY_DN12181_c0_g2_i2.p1 TRINITY_DN12181_c0_g2~~TRINITY_DN12181_c0_g2_i2.p1  ORF type:complete len:124 (-),score=9.01 TRINITY_DN12181_c0_g2_i2:97-468(-)
MYHIFHGSTVSCSLSSRHVSEASQHQHLEERSPGRTDSDMKRVQFDRYVKQQDGSVKDQQRASAKAKMKEDGKPPYWFTKLAQKREVQIVEGRLDSVRRPACLPCSVAQQYDNGLLYPARATL